MSLAEQQSPGGPGKTLVSVIIPCYNAAAHVEEAVASVLAQTHPVEEIICVDDGSSDDTVAVLHRLQTAHPDLIRVLEQPNGGAPSARNAGMRAAQGEYLQFLDADDVLHADKLERQQQLIASATKRPDLVAAPYVRRDPDGTEEIVGPTQADPWISLTRSELGTTGSNLWRKGFVEQVGGWNEAQKSSQEADLMFRMLQAGAHVVVDGTPALTVRKRAGSISTTNRVAFLRRSLDLRRTMRSLYETQGETGIPRIKAVNEVIFGILIEMYPLAPAEAAQLYREVLPPTFVPPRRRSYRLVCRALGFGAAQRFQRMYGRLRGSIGASTR